MKRSGRVLSLALGLGAVLGPQASGAQPVSSASPGVTGTPSPPASSPPAAPPVAADWACIERIPAGKERPKVTEKIAPNAISGHAQLLEVTIEHGTGETVLPTGFRLDPGSPETKSFEATGFVFPDPAGPSAPKVERQEKGDRATTVVKLYFIPLPKKPGRNALVLPRLPIAVARASGEIMTLCTTAHPVTVEDPIANDPHPKPKPNPPPRRQLEEWTLAKQLAIAGAIALVVGGILGWLIHRWMKRPRPEPPAPPPRPPWEVAMEALFDARHAGLLETQRHAEFFDRVSDVVRRYLGDRYGFDGLESTTRETLAALNGAGLSVELMVQVQRFMQDADLVKFARRTPSDAECEAVLAAAESIVATTRPFETPDPRVAAPPAAGEATP